MGENNFWIKSYDPGIDDLDPAVWETNYVDVVKEIFQQYSDKVALAFLGVEISFKEVEESSNRFACMLLEKGLKKGDVVGINLPNIPQYVIAWLGTLKAGCVVSGVSPLLSADEMAYQLKDSNAKGLVTLDAIFEKRLAGIASQLPELKLVIAAGVGEYLPGIKRTLGKLLGKIPKGKVAPIEGKEVINFSEIKSGNKYSSEEVSVKISPDDTAYIQYTGGTTGDPKGAVLSHRNAVSDLIIVQSWLGWEKGDGLALSGFPFFHIAGLFFNANCIFLGWTQVLVPNPRDTDYICGAIEKYRPTAIVNVPSLFQLMVANPKFRTLDHSKLEICISAAAPYPEDSQKELEEIVGRGKMLEVYGMTETSPLTTMNPAKGKKKLGSIGLPLTNTDLKLVDTTTGEVVKPGEAGEICVKGPMVMKEYLNKPEETKHAIDAEGYMHTGDVAIQDDEGYLFIVDRSKDMLIVGGFKVFSKKVEDVLAGHKAIGMIAIIGVPNPERPGSEFVKAFIKISHEYSYDGDEDSLKDSIINYAREKLAPYNVPRFIEFRDELPLTPVGKVDKKSLRAKY